MSINTEQKKQNVGSVDVQPALQRFSNPSSKVGPHVSLTVSCVQLSSRFPQLSATLHPLHVNSPLLLSRDLALCIPCGLRQLTRRASAAWLRMCALCQTRFHRRTTVRCNQGTLSHWLLQTHRQRCKVGCWADAPNQFGIVDSIISNICQLPSHFARGHNHNKL